MPWITFNCTYCGIENTKYYSQERSTRKHFCDCVCSTKYRMDIPIKPKLYIDVNNIDGVILLLKRIFAK